MSKKIIRFIILTILIFGLSLEIVCAESQTVEITDVEPLLEVQQEDEPLSVQWIHSNLLRKNVDSTAKKKTASTLPQAFSLKDVLPEVRDQGENGTCWAYGALASLESNLIQKGFADSSIDLSENHLVWFTYNGKNTGTKSQYAGYDTHTSTNPYNAGGNDYYSTATLARWYGAVNQQIAPTAISLNKSLQTESQIQISDVNYLENPTNEASQNTLKEYILQNGAVTISYYHDSSLFARIDGKYTYYCDEEKIPNHEVAIVGWDDTVETKASEKGAWLIRNSYGSDWGDDGYFYLSYADCSLYDAASFTVSDSMKPYDHIYQYDGTGFGDTMCASSVSIPGANRYTARVDELIQSVGTYTAAANSTVRVRIYMNPTSISPVSGTKLYEKTFSVDYAGYHILDLEKTISIPKGAVFTVVINTTCGSAYLLPAELQLIRGTDLSVDCEVGQSFLYVDDEWIDVTNIDPISGTYKIGNVMAKAYTKSAGSSAQKISVKTAITKADGCKSFSLNAKLTTGNGTLYYKSGNTSIASVNSKGTVTIKKPGKVTITITATPTSTYKTASKSITITVKPQKSTIKSVTSTKKKKLQIKWKKDSDVSGYKVMIATNKKFTKGKKTAIITSKNTVSKTFTKLSSGKKYYIKVCAYKTINGKKVYGDYSSVKTKKVK